jgi:hypothetical protein
MNPASKVHREVGSSLRQANLFQVLQVPPLTPAGPLSNALHFLNRSSAVPR